MNSYIKDLEKLNKILLNYVLVLTLIFSVFACIVIKQKTEIKIEKAKLEQQVTDYKWQLDQMQYIFDGLRGE